MTTAVRDIEMPPGTVLDEVEDLVGGYASAVLSTCGMYRYLLSRIWDRTLPLACWVMLNPSTADASRRDPTLDRVVDFTHRGGRGGLLIVNLFALRSADPRRLRDHHDPVGPGNDAFLAQAARAVGPAGAVIGAWGAQGTLHNRAAAVTALLAKAGVPLSCYGTTSAVSGHQPCHPLYLKGSTAERPYLETT